MSDFLKIPDSFKKEIKLFCELNNIDDVGKFVTKCFKKGYDIERYGLIGNSDEPEKIIEYVEKKVPIEVIKYIDKETIKEVPIEIIKEVEKEVINTVYVEKEIPIEKIVEVEKIVTKEVVVDRIVEVPIEVEKIIEVIKEVVVDKIVEVPVEKVVEVTKEIPIYISGQTETKVIEKIVEVPIEVEKIVTKEVIVDKIIEVEKIVVNEVIVEKIVEVPVQVEKIVEKIVQVEVIKEVEKPNDKMGMLQETLMKLRREMGDKDKTIIELNNKIEQLEKLVSNTGAVYMKGSNITQNL